MSIESTEHWSRDAQRDLETLARYASTILGRAMALEPTQPGTGGEDRDHHGLAKAFRILRRLVAVEWQHRLVLVYAYLVTGPEARERTRGFPTRIGLVFASPTQRMSWLTMPAKSMGLGAAAHQGDKRLRLAVQAYADAKDTAVANDGRWLPAAMDQVTRMDALASRDIRELVKAREQNRCSKPLQSLPNRAARRAALQHNKTLEK